MRDDLPEPVARQIAWQRRRAAREVGRMFDELVDAHIDPSPWLAGIKRLHAELQAERQDAA